MGYNSLILIANSAFLDVLRLSPFQTLFYRAMGAKVGKGVNINTSGLADLSMLEIGVFGYINIVVNYITTKID